jgi:hypothetical protein
MIPMTKEEREELQARADDLGFAQVVVGNCHLAPFKQGAAERRQQVRQVAWLMLHNTTCAVAGNALIPARPPVQHVGPMHLAHTPTVILTVILMGTWLLVILHWQVAAAVQSSESSFPSIPLVIVGDSNMVGKLCLSTVKLIMQATCRLDCLACSERMRLTPS